MVFIDGVKYACATCIKGHRSTACQHSDRPLFVIKRKGRPITQCSHCRELRKTQKVHVKCNCKERKEEESSSQAVAVLPRGISTTDEYDDYQPVTGDKTSVGALLNPCQCLTGAECICCRPINQHRFIDKEFATSNTSMNNANNSAQTPLYILPPISHYDNTKGKNTDPFAPSWENYCNNDKEYSSYSGHNNSSAGQRDNSYTSNSFTSDQNIQEISYDSSERRYSSSYDDKDNTDLKYRDQSEVLGEEVCRSSSTDLANLIYGPFQSCSSAMTDGSCCGSETMMSVCRCGSGCKCEGCDTHAKRINVGNYYNNTTFQQNQSSSGCCSSHEITQPEHTVVRDEDGVLLCGCGCQKLNTECSDCLENLCEEYLLKQP